jgi:heme exporter protein D
MGSIGSIWPEYPLAALFALVVAAAGWFYLFYSKAAGRLGGVEARGANVLRVRLRRVNGVAMLSLAVLFYAGFNAVVDRAGPLTFLAVWLGVMVLLATIVILVLVDVRLTAKLREQLRGRYREDQQRGEARDGNDDEGE